MNVSIFRISPRRDIIVGIFRNTLRKKNSYNYPESLNKYRCNISKNFLEETSRVVTPRMIFLIEAFRVVTPREFIWDILIKN